MTKIYSTEELIAILQSERQACLKGERLKLDIQVSGDPVIDQLMRTEGLQKFTAYQDFKAAIHEYQRQNKVSGIVWRSISLKGETLAYPEVDAQLIALPSDIEILQTAKKSILEFWYQVSEGMDLYLSISHGKLYQRILAADVFRIIHRTEWANINGLEKPNFLEIILQLGWGKPEEASYKRGFPDSGSEYIHAVIPGKQPIA
ncbi:hypothetical protein [Calothrix sp. 336/3]|uniref:hypothetical protein n=1 Tax=Calothrix sp. 336/3 TaxID=1337936 RepID=UPI0004E4292E|nr:hypothetical protein [Calothrix sp. 336/3]AKG21170.1 hypothetical protein IJ00_07530 [Calothrix sp. 336/3]